MWGALTMEVKKEAIDFIALLKACAKRKDLDKGDQLHADILKRGLLEKRSDLASSLISMYSKCGAIGKAQILHDQLAVPSVVSWNALIAGYTLCRQGHEALNCFEKMQRVGVSPNSITYVSVLKACGTMKCIDKGKQIHDEIVHRGFLQKNIVLGNALVDMYAKCNELAKARQVLEDLPVRDIFSWSALISGYTRKGHGHEALKCFERMHTEGLSPDAITFTCILKACGSTRNIGKGIKFHDEIIRKGLLENNVVLGNALVDMYAKCGVLRKAQQVLNELPVRDIVSWSSLIGGYTQHGLGHEALKCFEQMKEDGIAPDVVTFTCALKACSSTGSIEKGAQIHDEVARRGLLGRYIVLGNALVDMYAKCGEVVKAHEALEKIHVRDMISWSALIAGYVQLHQGHEALNCFERMKGEGLSPHVVTLTCILKACGIIGDIDKGKQIHSEIIIRGFLENNSVVGNALVDMYVKCGLLAKAQQVHDHLCIRDVVSWSALIAGYAQQGRGHEALNCFERLKGEGISPDMITFACILKACSSIGAIDKGKEIHDEIVHMGLLDKDIVLGNALVGMYAKCGALAKAEEVLQELPTQNIVSWSAVIAGYAQKGQAYEAFKCFERMRDEGFSPDAVTLLCVLNACSHSGLYDEAQIYFRNMRRKYGVLQNLEHHTCMVVNFGRGGHFDQAMSFINSIPSCDHLPVWLALLAACRKWGNIKLGGLAFDQAIRLDNNCAAAYILMSNIYAAAGIEEGSLILEAVRQKHAHWKKPSNNSWVDTS